MDQKTILIIIGTAILGILIGMNGASFFGNSRDVGYMHDMMNDNRAPQNMKSEMHGMMVGISDKTGDEFDEAFIDEMIVHHQGAVTMAESALKNAKHQEIKDLAQAIISAQNTEINQMKKWKSEWYPN